MSYLNIKVAKKYARVLFDLSKPDKLDARQELFSKFLGVLDHIDEVVSNPTLDVDTKTDIVLEALKEFRKEDEVFANFIKVVFENKRIEILQEIYDVYEDLVKEEKNILQISITVAEELSQARKDEIASRVKALLKSEIDVTWKISPEILGGIIIKYNDKLLNASIKGFLEQATKELVNF